LDIEDLLSLKIKPLSEIIKYAAALIALIAFLVFFAVSPMHALILCGLLVMLGNLYLKVEKEIRKMAFFMGGLLAVIGVLGIFIPAVKLQILLVAESLKQLMIQI
jgi:hypothetical protein